MLDPMASLAMLHSRIRPPLTLGVDCCISTRHFRSMKNEEVCVGHRHRDGRLLRSMEYWLQWNELAGSQAHFRLKLETVGTFEELFSFVFSKDLILTESVD